MQINSYNSGSTEQVLVEFTYSINLKSTFSQRTVIPDKQISAKFNTEYSTEASSGIGKTALYVYLGSIGIKFNRNDVDTN
jgi:hypothetical protein